MLWLIHWTDSHNFVGIRVSSLIKIAAVAFPLLALATRRERAVIILSSIVSLWVLVSYWRAQRTGYYRFVADDSELMAAAAATPLAEKKHISVRASGTFSLKDWEKNVVLKPAEYWQVPLGDHVLMVEHDPGRFLYQFFSAETMQELHSGWLLYGTRPHPAIAVTFLSSWGPEFNEDKVSLLGNSNNSRPTKIRTIYLSFDDGDHEKAVWQNLVLDARRVRSS